MPKATRLFAVEKDEVSHKGKGQEVMVDKLLL